MILQSFLAKECRKLHKIRLFLIDLLENYTHGMTDVCMTYMPGSSDAFGQIMTIVTYDVIGSISCRFLCFLDSALNIIAVEALADRYVKNRDILVFYRAILMLGRNCKSQEKLLPVYGNALVYDHCKLLVLAWLLILINGETKFLHPVFYGVVARNLSKCITQQLGEDIQDSHDCAQPTWCTHVDQNAELDDYKRKSMSGNRLERNRLCSSVNVIFRTSFF